MSAYTQLLAKIRRDRCGFVTEEDMPGLIALRPLCQCLIRCGDCRLVCAVQDVPRLIHCLEAEGTHIRDVSITASELDQAAAAQLAEELALAEVRKLGGKATRAPLPLPAPNQYQQFDPNDCGGAFDGFRVTSDADPGL